MPQYNQDSSIIYYEKAIQLLNTQKPVSHRELGLCVLDKLNFIDRNYSLGKLDSLSDAGWKNINMTDVALDKNRILHYDFLTNWAFIKLDNGKTKESLLLFSKAISMIKTNDDIGLQMKNQMNKGIFYNRYNLPEEKKIAFQFLKNTRSYYENLGLRTNAVSLFKIYKGFIDYYTLKNPDSVYYYLNQIKLILPYCKKPAVHAWYYCSYGRELITSPVVTKDLISARQYKEGKKNILQSLKIIDTYKIKNSSIFPYCSGLLADIFFKDKKYDLAIDYYSKSRNGYLNVNNRKGALDMLEYIGRAYQQKGDLGNALRFKKQYYEESLIYEKEKNERSLRENELQINVLKQDKQLSQKQNQLIIFIIFTTIVLFLLGLVYRNFRLKQKNNQQLETINTELSYKNSLLDKRNAEIEILMKEIHHRVKNNLEVVSSLLALQSAQIDDPNTKEAMKDGQNRVNSIGIVHQKLYQGTNLGAVDIKDYFLNLSESILDSFGAEGRVNLKLAIENLALDIDTAVPLGLIINELLTNTIKYAFPKGEKGIITIKLEKHPNNILHLEVADNGVGKSGIIYGTGFGGQLVSLLTNQLNGTMREENQNGTVIIFDFKLKKSA
ncbi:MAG: histidine kinase [Flavobacterium micromati]|nr:histidine kinase [Flavobacterium micromati]